MFVVRSPASTTSPSAKRHEMLDMVPVVFVIRTETAEPEAIMSDAIIAACRSVLADFKVPCAVYFVEEFPRRTGQDFQEGPARARRLLRGMTIGWTGWGGRVSSPEYRLRARR